MRPFYSVAAGLLLIVPLGFGYSQSARAAEPDGPAAVISPPEAIRLAVEKQLSAQFTTATETRKQEQAALVEYYSTSDSPPIWVDQNGLTDRGKAVIAELKHADDYGLRAADYSVPDLTAYDPKSFASDPAGAADKLAADEIQISFDVVRYASDARGGRIDPSRLTPNLDPSMRLPKPIEVMESIALRSDAAAYLRSFEPSQPQFDALREMLIKLRGGDETTAPSIVLPAGQTLRKGVQDPQVALLRKRLDVSEDASDGKSVDPNLFDDAVDHAVKQFQQAHGVAPDGLVGPGTRRILNGKPAVAVGSADKIRLILVNMERWRWLPDDLGPFYVRVNVPEFELRVVQDRKVIHSARVVVGMPSKQTPIFQQDMQTIVFNPSWAVPNSIKTEEIKPYIQRADGGWFSSGTTWDTSILDRHNLKINVNGHQVNPQTIDWDRVDIRTLAMTQPPGPDNVLGVVKFVFPNKHDVYLHDTTERFLFAKTIRAESHGCMRVQNPDQLATVILHHDQDWDHDRVMAEIHNSYDQGIPLRQHIPVYITYFTAWANPDGSLSTYGDLYGHDARMERALNL